MKWIRLAVTTACLIGDLIAQRVGAPTDDLTKVAIDELFSIQVTSVGRKAQELSKAPAAVFVLTAEDIRRTGATSIPEALRWVPGLTVASQDGRSWDISVRGSTRLYADKILVMIDGRSLYTPLFSGVIWDSVDVPLGDVEQIEIVRGPGAVMWGPNAVNGVINIITKRSQSTAGAQVSVATGNALRGAAEARVGQVSDKVAYRVWGKLEDLTPAYGSPGYFSFTDFVYRDPSIKDLDQASGRLGFRVDGQPNEKNHWMIQGDIYKVGREDADGYPAMRPGVERFQEHSYYDGGFLQARWTHTSATGNESELRFSYDDNNIGYPYVHGALQNLTADYQRRRQTGAGNEVYWGAGYQQYWDSTRSSRFASFDPADSLYRSGYGVLRDEWQIVPDRLLCSAGVRLDYNSFRQVEYQPSIRLLFTPNARQSGWVAVSRAVRTPNRLDRDLEYEAGYEMSRGFPVGVLSHGNKAQVSETARSAEAGYRYQAGQRWSIDASIFYTMYGRLRALANSTMPMVSIVNGQLNLSANVQTGNLAAGRSYGGEFWGTWQVRPGWRLIPTYSYDHDAFSLPPASPYWTYMWDLLSMEVRHQATLRTQHDMGRQWQIDVMGRARSRELAWGLPGSFLIDARVSWRPTRNMEWSFSLNNVLNRQVLEAVSEDSTPVIPLRRTVLVKWNSTFLRAG